jgi:glucosyl-3-phosphoglycerate synthase
VHSLHGSGGKGQAMAAGFAASRGDLVVFLDGDVENTGEGYIPSLLGPLLDDEHVALVKGYYDRPLGGSVTGGGRVTELVARPILDLLHPELAAVRQPLAGETAGRRSTFASVGFSDGYGVEMGLLLDVAQRFGTGSIAQVDLGIRIHRNRPIEELRPMARDVLEACLSRSGTAPRS